MKSLRRAGRLCAAMQVGFALGFVFVATGRGQEAAGFTEVTPNVLVFATRTGNVVALVGPDGALLIGTPSADSTERISSELAKRTKSPARYVRIAPEAPADAAADPGWGRRGGSRVSRGAGARRSDDRRGPESVLRHDRHCSRPRAPFDRCRAHGEPGDRGASDGGV